MSILQKQAQKRLKDKATFNTNVPNDDNSTLRDDNSGPASSVRHLIVKNKADSLLKLSVKLDDKSRSSSNNSNRRSPNISRRKNTDSIRRSSSPPNSARKSNKRSSVVRIASNNNNNNNKGIRNRNSSKFKEMRTRTRSQPAIDKKKDVVKRRVKLKRIGVGTAQITSSGRLSARRVRRAADDSVKTNVPSRMSRRASLPVIRKSSPDKINNTENNMTSNDFLISEIDAQYEAMTDSLKIIALAKQRQSDIISPYGLPSNIELDGNDFLAWEEDLSEQPYESVRINTVADAAEAEAASLVAEASDITKRKFEITPELRALLENSTDAVDANSTLEANDPLYDAKKGAYQYILKCYRSTQDTTLDYEAYLTYCSETNIPLVDPRLFDEQLLMIQLSIKKLENNNNNNLPIVNDVNRINNVDKNNNEKKTNGPDLERLFQHALHCYNEEQYDEAARCFQLLASVGHTGAQFGMACCFNCGLGVKEDAVTALKYFMLAAVQNHFAAQVCVGACYYAGYGLRRDDAKAVYWFKKSADRNNTAAMFLLAGCYMRGEGNLPKSVHSAVKYYKLSAAQDYTEATCTLARLYYDSKGHADEDEHFDDLNDDMNHIAEDDSDNEALAELAPKPVVSDKDKKRAFKLWNQCAKIHDFAPAHVHVGICFEKGEGCTKNIDNAIKHYEKAALANHPRGLALLATMHWKELVSNPVHARAHRFFEKSIALGDRQAIVELREMTREDLEFLAPLPGYVAKFKKISSSGNIPSCKSSHDNKKLVEERNEILEEIIESESLFCYQLFLLDRHYLSPIVEQKLAKESISDALSECAQAVNQISTRHKAMLTKFRQESNKNLAPMILRDTIDTLGAHYMSYCSVYKTIVRGLGGASISKDLRKHLETKAQAYGHDSIVQMLVLPVQRIPRYLFLIEALLESTPNSHRYCKDWRSAYVKVRELTTDVETCRQAAVK